MSRRPPHRRSARFGLAASGVTAAVLACACGGGSGSTPPAELRDQPAATTSVDGRARVVAGAGGGTPVDVELPRNARYVAPNGDDRAAGSASAPWRTLGHAVESAPEGATVVLREGTYRESVELTRTGLTLRAFPGESVWMDGADPVEQRARPQDGAWVIAGWGGHEPERLDGGSHLLAQDRPEAGWPDMVFLDGRPLREVPDRASLSPGCFWVDVEAQQIWLGEDPGDARIEASARAWGLYLDGADRTTVIGVGFRRFATPARLIAPLRVHADDVVVHDVVAEDNAYAGISVMGSDVLLQQVSARRNGQLGVQARHADGLVLRRSVLAGNNTEGFDTSQQAGGVKVTASRRVSVVDNVVQRNAGPGIWLDQSVVGATIARNLVTGNDGSGVELELSAELVVAGNMVADNGRNGLYVLESGDVLATGNHLVGNEGRDVWIVEGSRTVDDPTSHDLDDRHRRAPDSLTFDVHDISIVNNVVGDLPDRRAEALVGVEDAARHRAADDMGIELDHNAYWRAPGGGAFSTWADYPGEVAVAGNLSQHREVTGTDAHSRWAKGRSNPWVTGEGAGLRVAEDEWLRDGGTRNQAVVDDLLGLRGAHPVGVPEELALPVPARGA